LTIAGRDRARGRVILRPLPDPGEDDDRPITGMTLEEIARTIGDTYSGSQLPRYLRESGIPEEFIPAELIGSKWEYVLGIFGALHDGGSAARRATAVHRRVARGALPHAAAHGGPEADRGAARSPGLARH
jgi:hypothetical protein